MEMAMSEKPDKSDLGLLLRLQVLEARCEQEGMYVRSNTAFLARRRLMQLLGVSDPVLVDYSEITKAVMEMP
jgi:hypothetical protein